MPGFACRGGGIRTPGTLRYNGFQDRRIRPLCHSSVFWSDTFFGRDLSNKCWTIPQIGSQK